MIWTLIWFLCGALCGASAVGLLMLYVLGGGFDRRPRPGRPPRSKP